ncbi:hydrolase [Dorea longicatena]|uniref:coiled-coil domain-containing protein n=1 Tax=Dorea longicatena TaxID=88431 RepID=UPI00156E419F|nr:C40 family peptidase [Dorea longicatena]NSD04844.1 hydrolase [Dorea longicatena]NSD16471.1 hydrolase [Dorea longicatena]NSK08313.1 hydrolase [Blautia sp. MSK.20.9]
MNKHGIRLITAVVTSSMIVTPVLAAPSVDDLKKEKASKQNEVSSLQSQLTTLMGKVNTLESELIQTGEDITKAQSDLVVAQKKEKEQYAAMKKRIKYMYEAGNDSAFETLVTSDDFTDLLSKAEYVQNVHSYDRKQLQEYVETKQQISDLKDSLEKDQKELESKQAEYEKQGDNLNNLITSKSAEVANLDSEIQAAAEAAAKEAAERAAKEAAEKAAKEAAKKQQASAANNSTSSNRHNSTTSNNTTSNKHNTSNTTRPSGNNTSSNTTSGSNANGGTIVSRAYSQLGKPYVWGAYGPSSFDCSGFVSYCLTGSYTRLGTTLTFMGWTRVSNPQPGDVVTTATHCGIYIGNGQMIHAPHTGDVVKVGPVQSGMIYVRR